MVNQASTYAVASKFKHPKIVEGTAVSKLSDKSLEPINIYFDDGCRMICMFVECGVLGSIE